MTLRELAMSGIKFKKCSVQPIVQAIVEYGSVDFPVTYTEDLSSVAEKWMDRQVLSIYPENRMLFIEVSKETSPELISSFDFDGMQRQTVLDSFL